MIVLAKRNTPRLQYIINFFSSEISGSAWQVTDDLETFSYFDGPRINYTDQTLSCNCIHIAPHELLFGEDIRRQDIKCSTSEGFSIFFQTNCTAGFDLFAAAFYLLTRYEEYLTHDKDKHGRYLPENSLAFRENFLQIPLINVWLEYLKKLILIKFENYQLPEKCFTFLPTYDIDMAWSYLNKGFLLNGVRLAADLVSGKFRDFNARYQVLSGKEKDPFDTFSWLDCLHEKFRLKPIYFFLVAEHRSVYDKNISPYHLAMKKLIKEHADKYDIALHPSWVSAKADSVLEEEKKILEQVCGRRINSSRQHYIQLNFPATYRSLLNNGIINDYSMGYPSINGFRASVASPFKWYDLQEEKETQLTVHPFCFMEGNSIFYQKQTINEGMAELTCLYQQVEKVNGFFSMIWHNSSFANTGATKGWKEAYGSFLKDVSK